jgi:hypothetical protein
LRVQADTFPARLRGQGPAAEQHEQPDQTNLRGTADEGKYRLKHGFKYKRSLICGFDESHD